MSSGPDWKLRPPLRVCLDEESGVLVSDPSAPAIRFFPKGQAKQSEQLMLGSEPGLIPRRIKRYLPICCDKQGVIVDTTARKVIARCDLPGKATAVCVDSPGVTAFIATAKSNQVLAIDAMTGELRGRFDLSRPGGKPGIADASRGKDVHDIVALRWADDPDRLLALGYEGYVFIVATLAPPFPKDAQPPKESAVKGPDQATTRAIEALLPEGWSVRRDRVSLVIARDEPVEYFSTVNLPDHSGIDELRKEGFTHKTRYTLTLRFGPPITRERYRQLSAKNSKISRDMAAMRGKMRHIHHKFDSYLPNTPEDRRLVETYERLGKSLHDLPDCHDEKHSVWVGESVDWPCDFASEKVRHQCATVRNKVLARFQTYRERK